MPDGGGAQMGNIKSVTTTSMGLNGQPGQGTQRPMTSGGNASPGGSKPPKPADGAVPMPK